MNLGEILAITQPAVIALAHALPTHYRDMLMRPHHVDEHSEHQRRLGHDVFRTGGARQRPDSSQMADDLFQTGHPKQGLSESAAWPRPLGSNSSSTSSASAEEVFKSLDSDSDVQADQTERWCRPEKSARSAGAALQAMRTRAKGDMPPPPPPGDGDTRPDG